MQNQSREEQEGQEWLKRYRAMRDENESVFIDLEGWDFIIFHYLQNDDPAQARVACETGLRTFPSSPELQLSYGHILFTCGEMGPALEAVNKAEPFLPNDADLILLKCSILNQEGRFQESLLYLQACMEEEPDQPEKVFYILGSTLHELNLIPDAISAFGKALEIDPVFQECLEELSLCLEEDGRLEDAIPYFRNAIDHNPFDPELWMAYAILLNQAEEWEEAIDAVDYCLALDDKKHIALFQRANILINLRRFSEAAEDFEKAIHLYDQQAEYFVGLGAALEMQQKPDQAIHWFRKSVKINPNQADGYFGIGACLLQMEKYAESLHFFTKAIQIDDANSEYWMSKAIAENNLGNVVSAEEAFCKVYELDPEHVGLWLDWSNLYFEQGDTEKAIAMLDEAIALMPDEAMLYYRAAAYHFAGGFSREALLYLENGIVLDYDGHAVLYDFFDDVKTQKFLYNLVQEIRNKGKKE